MANGSAETWLGQLQDALAERFGRWTAAIEVIAGPGLERGRPARTEAELVGVAFARFLAGEIQGDELLETVGQARPDAFWAALDAFMAGASEEERRQLSGQLLTLPAVRRERGSLRDLSSWRRALAARRLGMLDAPEMCEPLRKAMARGPERVTLTAALALARLRDRQALRWLLQHPRATRKRTRRQLAGLLERFGPEVVEVLRAALASGDAAAPIYAAAIDVLGLRGDLESVGRLEGVLRSGPLDARVAAARALGRIAAPGSRPALIAALDEDAWQVRAQAARALGAIPDPANVAPLAGRVGDVAWWVRRHAAYALGRHGEEGARALEEIDRSDQDLFAADVAREVLQRLEWEEEAPGAFHRVA